MDPVEEFAGLKARIKAMEDRAAVLRASFLRPGARLSSNQHEVIVRRQVRQVLRKDLLPPEILDDPRYWSETVSEVVLVRALENSAKPLKDNDDIVLVEPFWPAPAATASVTRR